MGTRNVLAAALLALACAAPPCAAETLPIRRYTTADGLPHLRVKAIRRDRSGFVWFCTTEGLSRFDGRSFVSYGVADGLPVPSVNDILEAPGGYWIATNGGGLALFRPDARPRFRRVAAAAGDGAARINVLLVDAKGTLWAGTDGGLFRLREAAPGRAVLERVPLGMPGRTDAVQVFALLADGGGILAGTRFGLVRRLADGHTRVVSLSNGGTDQVHGLARADDGSVLAAHTAAGLFVLEPATLATRHRYTTADGLPSDSVASVAVLGGRVLAGTAQGLAVFSGGRVTAYTTRDGLPAGEVGGMVQDADGGLWIATLTSGALRLSGWNLALYGADDGVAPNVSKVFELRDGTLCGVSSDWRIGCFDGHRFRTVRPRLPAALDAARWRVYHGVLEDREGDFWVATDQGIFRFAAGGRPEALARVAPKTVYTAADGLANADVAQMLEDRRGDVWIGTFSVAERPLTRWVRATGRFERYGAPEGLPALGAVHLLAEDAAGDVWISYTDTRLARCRGGKFRVVTGAHGFPNAAVAGFTNDPTGRFWIATAGSGLLRVDRPDADEPEAIAYGAAQGIADFYLSGLASDEAGRITFGTSHDLKRLDPASGEVTAIVESHQLITTEVSGALRARDGKLWFASWAGLARLDPRPEPEARPASVRIASLSVSGRDRTVSALGETAVAAGELPPAASVAIRFFGVGLTGQTLGYEHRLEGLETGWSAPDPQGAIQFAHLPPGTYRFVVRAVGVAGIAGPQAEVRFTMLAPVWRRWWFVCGCVALLLTLGYGAKAAADVRQRERAAIRARIASDLHDDLGASVARIGILSEVARRRAREGGGSAEMLETIGEAARSALEKLSEGIWAVDPRRDDLQSLADRLRLVADELLGAAGVSWRIEVLDGGGRAVLPPDVRRQVYLVMKEALTNAARHAQARTLELLIRHHGRRLSLEMKDDGRGFDPECAGVEERLVGGRGLTSMRTRAAALGGTFTVRSAPGEGTRLTLEIPFRGA